MFSFTSDLTCYVSMLFFEPSSAENAYLMSLMSLKRQEKYTNNNARFSERLWYILHSRGIHLLSFPCWNDDFANDEISDIFLLPCRRTASEPVALLFLYSLVRFNKVPQHFCVCGSDNACIDVGTWAEIVEDTRWDCSSDKVECLFPL